MAIEVAPYPTPGYLARLLERLIVVEARATTRWGEFLDTHREQLALQAEIDRYQPLQSAEERLAIVVAGLRIPEPWLT